MNDIVKKSHMISVFMYFICSIILAVVILIENSGEYDYIIGTAVFAMLSLAVLAFILVKRIPDGIYEVIYLSFFTVLSLDVQFYVHNIYILFMAFMLEWIICFAFMRKRAVVYLGFLQIATICAFTFLPETFIQMKQLSLTCFIVSVLFVLFAMYESLMIIRSFKIVLDSDKEELKSMDDLYRISFREKE